MANQIKYNSKQKRMLHQLIEALFTVEEFNKFVAYFFPPVHKYFKSEQSYAAKIRMLLEYCDKHDQLKKLIKDIQRAKPKEYRAYAQQKKSPKKEPEPEPKPEEPKEQSSQTGTEIVLAEEQIVTTQGADPEQVFEQLLGDRYRMEEILDAEGQGFVYRAYDVELDLEVAIKIVDLNQLNQPALRERVQQEARTLMKLDNPGIIQVYNFGQIEGIFYMVMEFIAGYNLRELREDYFSGVEISTLTPQILRLFHKLCKTINYLHQHSVLHPNTKLRNIMVRPGSNDDELGWEPVLINLGLLRPHRDALASREGLTVQQLIYQVSPEFLLGHNTDIRSDIYALGIVLYDLFVGRPPFRPGTYAEAVTQHVEQPPRKPRSLNPNIPKPVEQIILTALAKNPADRYLSMKEMAQALVKALTQLEGSEAVEDVMTETRGMETPIALPTGEPETLEADIKITRLDAKKLIVTPGTSLTTSFTLRNKGGKEAECRVQAAGVPSEWVAISPSVVSLEPGEAEEIELVIEPPRSSEAEAKNYSLVVRIDSMGEEIVELDEFKEILEVETFSHFDCELWPKTLSEEQVTQITVKNLGNHPQSFTISLKSDEKLTSEPHQQKISLEPGKKQTVDFNVIPHKPLIGASTSQTFSFLVIPSQGDRATLSGELETQGRFRPQWVIAGVVAFFLMCCAIIPFYNLISPSEAVVGATATSRQATLEAPTLQAIGSATTQAQVGTVQATQTAIWQTADYDFDGLSNGQEREIGTNIDNRDTDGDGLDDGAEVNQLGTDPLRPDSDFDSLPDGEEIRLGYDPNNRDSDTDGTPDAVDSDPGQRPTPTPTLTPVTLPVVRFQSSVYTGNEQQQTASITVVLDRQSSNSVTINYTTREGTARPDEDYTPVGGTLLFAPGETSKTFTVPLTNDNLSEGEESLVLELSNPQNATLGNSQATLRIQDGDNGGNTANTTASIQVGFGRPLSLPRSTNSRPQFEVNENWGEAMIDVWLNVPSRSQVQVDYTTADNTAIAGQDYNAMQGTLIFEPGEVRQSFRIRLINDAQNEENRVVVLRLNNPVGAVIDTPEAELIIFDDD